MKEVSMKRIALLFSLVLVLGLAIPAFVGESYGDRENTASHEITGVLEGTIKFVPFPNATSPMDVDALGHAEGVIKGLGRANMFTFHRPLPDGTGVMDGLVKIVTASHDTLEAQYVGTAEFDYTVNPPQVIGHPDFEITGGTGRFANASGTIYATSYVTFLGFEVFEWPVIWILEGIVEY
jgi:hypothetical protein